MAPGVAPKKFSLTRAKLNKNRFKEIVKHFTLHSKARGTTGLIELAEIQLISSVHVEGGFFIILKLPNYYPSAKPGVYFKEITEFSTPWFF
jgi:hypothetical protein